MNPHNLPPLPPLGQLPSPGTTHTNPGIVDVASQCFPAVRAGADQSQTPCSLSSASLVFSDGDAQRPAQLDTIGSNGVTVSTSSAPLLNLSGEGGQRIDRRAPDVAVSTGQGLPAEVHADFVSHARPLLPDIAQTTSPAVTVNANTNCSGGLPTNVLIR